MKAKKTLAMILSIVMLLSVLTASVFAEDAAEAVEAAETEEAAEDSLPPIRDAVTVLENIYNYYPANKEILTVNGMPVTWEEYAYWLNNAVYSLYNVYITYLQGLPADMSDGDQLAKADAAAKVGFFRIAHEYAETNSVPLTAEQQESVDSAIDALTAQLGPNQNVDEMLAQSFMTRKLYTDILHYSCDMNNMMEREYGAKGELMSEADVLAWAEENEYVRTKHILRMFPAKDAVETDENGEPVDAAAAAAAEEAYQKGVEELRAEMDGYYDELKALEGDSKALTARFDEIMNEKSEDTGLTVFPDGYTFTHGTMVAAYEDAAYALKEYAISPVTESSYGYHIILRLPMEADMLSSDRDSGTGANMTLRQSAAVSMFNEEMLEHLQEADVQYLVDLPDLNTLADGNGMALGGAGSRLIALIIVVGICAITAVVIVVLKKKKSSDEPAAEEVPAEIAEEAPAEAEENTPAETEEGPTELPAEEKTEE